MTAGELKEWIAVFLPDLAPDGAGGFTEAVPAGLVADTPAKVEQTGGQVAFGADQTADRATHRVTIRFQAWVTSNYRVMWRDLLLDQVAPPRNLESAGDTWLELSCIRRELGAQ